MSKLILLEDVIQDIKTKKKDGHVYFMKPENTVYTFGYLYSTDESVDHNKTIPVMIATYNEFINRIIEHKFNRDLVLLYDREKDDILYFQTDEVFKFPLIEEESYFSTSIEQIQEINPELAELLIKANNDFC